MSPASRRPRCGGATSTSSTARRCSSPTPGHASWIVCFASTDRAKGHKGLTALVIPMDAEGVTIEKKLDKMGQRATDTSRGRLPGRRRSGREPARRGGRGLQDRDADARLHAARERRSARSASRRRRSSSSVDYAKERVQFGMPIAMNQGVSFLDRGHGNRDRGLAPALLAGRLDDRRGIRPQGDQVLLVRQAVCSPTRR